VHQIWYVAAVGKLHTFYDCLQSADPGFGYFPQAVKIWLLVKHFYATVLKVPMFHDGQSMILQSETM